MRLDFQREIKNRVNYYGAIFDREITIGEAAGFISPSSAEGFSYAFKSALALSNALAHGLESWSELYKKNTADLRRNIILKNLKSPFMYNQALRKCVMQSGLKSIVLNVNK